MVVLLRILFLVLIASSFLINLGWRRRIIAIAGLSLLLLVATIVAISLSGESGPTPDVQVGTAVALTPAPTREPEVPSFESACRQFQLVIRDVETGDLNAFRDREKRFDEIRANATFPGSPSSFLGLFDAYAEAVNEKLGENGVGMPPALSDTDVNLLDRVIRRARDNMLSECRARQG